jgi:hypothetical protein
VFALVLGFFFLDAFRTWGDGMASWATLAWQIGMASSVVVFLVLRFLKKRTTVLHVEGREFKA